MDNMSVWQGRNFIGGFRKTTNDQNMSISISINIFMQLKDNQGQKKEKNW